MNFGPSHKQVITVKKMVDLVIKHWGKGKYLACSWRGPHEAGLLRLNTSKAKALIGWKPQIGFKQTMKDLLNYWQARV